MDCKTKVPKSIRDEIGRFQLPREVLIQLITRMHHDVPRDYQLFRKYRVQTDERSYRYRFVISEKDTRHLFTFAIDDTTAAGFFIFTAITHNVSKI